jgi:uncharacterized repeat protein (TIGR03803 family)
MKEVGLSKMACLIVMFLITATVGASAQTFQTVITFSETNGAVPTAVLVQGTDGNFYGTTQYGGTSDLGTVFRLTPTGALTTLYSFCAQLLCTDGSLPDAGLIQGSDGNFYGTTFFGGSQDAGTIFKITANGKLTTIYSFCSAAKCADGENPHAGLVQASDGNFYGTTSDAGAGNAGTAFKITPAGVLTTLYGFCALAQCADGSTPEGGLIQGRDGNFYGTTSAGGGASNGGTVFRLTSAGGLTTLYDFCSLSKCADGEFPYAGLAQGSDGNFYGTTSGFAPTTMGTVFKITPSGTLTTIYSFCSLANCADGEFPFAGVIQGSDGNFYGTTEAGANSNLNACPLSCGTFFRLTPNGALTTLYSFCSLNNCTDGGQPVAGLVQARNGTMYGTTSDGGVCATRVEGCGTIFSWSTKVALAPTLSPSSLNYGNQAIDTSSTARTVTIKNVNTGFAILDLNSITVSGSTDFKISANTCPPTLTAGMGCKVSLTYTPTSLGAESATLNVADNGPGSPQKVPMSGTGVQQTTVSPVSLTYPKQKVGTTSPGRNVTLRSNLSTTLTGISLQITKPFAVSASTCGKTLPANSSCTISVVFSPTITGTVNGTLTIKDSANNSPQTVSLTGTGD